MKTIEIIAQKNLTREIVSSYYVDHTGPETAQYFELQTAQINRVLDYFEIPKHSVSESKLIVNSHTSREAELARRAKISATEKGHVTSAETKKKISESNKKNTANIERLVEAGKATRYQKGHQPWDTGTKGKVKRTAESIQKYNESCKKNNSYKNSKMEQHFYEDLCKRYGKDNVIRQYNDGRYCREDGYKYNCDFYVKSEDLFIEYNGHPCHGNEPYNCNDKEHLELAEQFKVYDWYHIWCETDVDKWNCAKNNNLKFVMVYPIKGTKDYNYYSLNI